MAYIRDLTPCTYNYFSRLTPLLAIGWLEPVCEFPRGTVKRATRNRLEALFSAAWSPVSFFGSHTCGFCAQAAGIDHAHAARMRNGLPRGSANILIPGRKVVYVAPELILHYIDAHQYRPPSAFTDAVDACPRMASRGYFLALIAAGGDMPGWFGESLKVVQSTPRGIADPDIAAARQAVLLWRNPLTRAWCRSVRNLMTRQRLSAEPVWKEVIAAHEALQIPPFPRQRVSEFLLRVSNAGHAVYERGDDFVLPHPDGDMRVSPIDVRWVVRRQKGSVWYPYGAAANEAELERFLSSALGSPIL